jgi:hypothetical protein
MTYDEFIKKHNGVAVNYDGTAGKQCVDLATAYFNEVFGSGIKNFWYDAHHFWDLFDKNTWLKANFTKVKNTPSFVPKKGDVAIWSGTLNGGWGHIAICTGEGNTKYFYSYDQNWTGRNDPCTKIKHNYNHVLGVLRPKNQNAINPPTLETKGYKKGASTDGSYALKQLLILDGAKLDDNAVIGKGTVSAINARLKAWGYKQNGIAGKKFIKKLREKIKK